MKNNFKIKEDEFVKYIKDIQKLPISFKPKTKDDKVNEKDDLNVIMEEVLDIMEFGEKDMYGEYYASRSKKIDVYLLPILPTEVITIKVDDLKKINPQLHEGIVRYSTPIYDADRTFSKLYKNLVWKKTKNGLLLNALTKKD